MMGAPPFAKRHSPADVRAGYPFAQSFQVALPTRLNLLCDGKKRRNSNPRRPKRRGGNLGTSIDIRRAKKARSQKVNGREGGGRG